MVNRDIFRGSQPRHQGCADAGLTVAISQPPDGDMSGRQEVVESPARPHGRAGRHGDLEAPEGDRMLARATRTALRSGPVEPLRQRSIVEIGGNPRSRVERIGAGLVFPAEKERVGVDGGREIVRPRLRLLRVEIGELGEREEPVLAPLRVEGGAELREGRFRLSLESLPQIEPLEDLVGELAGCASGEGVGGRLPLERLPAGSARRRPGWRTPPSGTGQRPERATRTRRRARGAPRRPAGRSPGSHPGECSGPVASPAIEARSRCPCAERRHPA